MSTKSIDERLIPVKQRSVPTTGQTVTVQSGGYVNLVIAPAGSLLNLTIALPSDPQDGDVVRFSSSQAITTLSMTAGVTIVAALTSLLLGGGGAYIYDGTGGVWHPIP